MMSSSVSQYWMLRLSLGSRWHSDPSPYPPGLHLQDLVYPVLHTLPCIMCNDQKPSPDKMGPHPHCPLWPACQEAVISLSCPTWTVGTEGSLLSSAEMPQLQRGTGHSFCECISQASCSGSRQSSCLSSFYSFGNAFQPGIRGF